MKKKRVVLLAGFLMVLTLGCSIGNQTVKKTAEHSTMEAVLQQTLTAVVQTQEIQALELTRAAVLVAETARSAQTAVAGTQVPPASDAPSGTISGKLSFPSDHIPPLEIIAFSYKDGAVTSDWYLIDTELNQMTYEMKGLPVGTYVIVAYTNDRRFSAGYSQAVPCGLRADCVDHSLIPVTVTAGATITNIDPGDWYAGEGAFPPCPFLK